MMLPLAEPDRGARLFDELAVRLTAAFISIRRPRRHVMNAAYVCREAADAGTFRDHHGQSVTTSSPYGRRPG